MSGPVTDRIAWRNQGLRRLLRAYRDIHGVTAYCLHIVLDDGNLDDESIRWCVTHAQDKEDFLGLAIAALLMDLDLQGREEARIFWWDLTSY